MNVKWYQLGVKDIEKKLHVICNKGLTSKQLEQRRKKFGKNELIKEKKASLLIIFMKQFQDFMVLVLLAATLIAGMLGEYIDAIAIMVIVLINGCIGFFQEQRAENSLEKLRELSAPMTRVLRDGVWEKIPSQQLVIGDVIRLNTGDRIPADVRIVEEGGLETEESTLTGESLPVSKTSKAITQANLDIQDQHNMGFMGTLVTRGQATGIVVQVGMNTEIGKIASLMASTKKVMTPLELKLADLGKTLIIIVFLLVALTVGIGVYQGNPIYSMFLAGVSLAVAAIPEGLPAIVTVALSLGVQRMIRQKAIIRKLSAVETLGSATVICSDKTGTITENEMTVKELYLNGQHIFVSGDGYSTIGQFYANEQEIDREFPQLESMLLYGMLCNQANLFIKRGKYIIDGDPTDGALLIAARKLGLGAASKEQYKIIKEFPFDSEKKRMSVVIEDENKRRFLISKGAPEMILPRCTQTVTEYGHERLANIDELNETVYGMTKKALRTIAISIKPLTKDSGLDRYSLERDLIFVGLFGLMDPPRKEVPGAIKQCQEAGIKTVMITGDHKKTAEAIATNIGLLPEGGLILEGAELNNMNSTELKQVINDVYVFARVTPEHKLKIVKALQSVGHIVAMTGDGVNDAPAIKASNIGISMGMTGTDVTKEASSVILMDDNFNTIKEAIREGRNIYENIRKFIRYLLTSNVGEILVVLLAMILALPLPLVPVQILWVNLVTDGLPALALGLDPPEKNVMKRSPRHPKEGIFSRGLGTKIVSRGILIGVVTLIAFMIVYDNNPDNLTYGRTVAFATLVLAQLIHVFDCRNENGLFTRNPLQNKFLVLAVISSLSLLLIVIYSTFLQPIFHTTALTIFDWALIVLLSALPTLLFALAPKKKKD